MNLRHGRLIGAHWPCPYCPKWFVALADWRAHIETHPLTEREKLYLGEAIQQITAHPLSRLEQMELETA